MTTIYLSFGSNLGNKLENIRQALKLLNETNGIKITKVSSIYETAPVGGVEQDYFLNGVCELETELTPYELLEAIQSIEYALKRVRKVHWGPRTLDLDILLFEDTVMNEARLTIPHPYMHERSFVLIPMNEIAPGVTHPVLHKTINEMVFEDKDVIKISEEV
ncbi:2-amino-4-hydroxy-6-hydroxymethyldihydropteridine diphosphokinase [Macrococcus sp. DPC7161]|uniref:2-amino-4-hydroxy-6- hydroxymethyldihydropteridine diphosphokinase n=1 Tax=Macrococcus sp. DPC7161 TaxID=2507060 RepID=UPI00100A38C2|nr:2-amino-4-hydroxy-6-hydroxymethyldihydropteridine diphosphokinase [Macrococcus sp. DPC7161]RXK17217.1 2-amino-4-hydroxy-6-hydroxymethyldihydropteridine diphosphokinase [Macrococcus sp. DPC7161]